VATYEDVHAGDHVLGHDNGVWGVAEIDHAPALRVVLVQPGHRVQGWPPPGTPVTILHRKSVAAEFAACELLAAGGLGVELIGERWTE
jgi:hypothetical protein